MDILEYIKTTSFARPSEKPQSTVQPSPTLEKRDDITPIESHLIPMSHPVARPTQVTSLSSHSSIPGPASLLPNSPTKDIAYGTEKLVDKIELRPRNRHQIGLPDEQKKHTDTETNSQEIKPAQTLTISSSHRQDRFHCDFTGCRKHFEHKYTLTRHKKIHTNVKKFRCDVHGCDQRYRENQHLKKHKSIAHSIPGPTSLLPNSPTKDITYGSEKLTESIKVYEAIKRNKLYARNCRFQHLKKILKGNTAGFSQEEYLKALLDPIPNTVRQPFNLFFRLMRVGYNLSALSRDIWFEWLSQPTDPVYKSLLSQVIRITDPRSKESLLKWSVNTDSTQARDIKAWIKKVLPDETFENLPKESEIASSMTSVPHHPINPRKRRRNRHQIGLPDEQKKRQKKPMPSAALPAFLPEDCKWSPSHGHQPAQETPELLPQNSADPGSSTTSFTSEKIDNALNFILFSQTSPVTQVSQSVTKPAVLADTETNSQEIKPAQTLTISGSHRQDRLTITEPAIPAICITSLEEDRHSQVFPAIPAGHSVHDFLTVSDAKALPIALNNPHSGTAMGTRLFPPYTLRQWQQNLIKVRQLPDGKIMTAAQNCTKVVDKLIEGSYSDVFTQADPAPASGLEDSSDIKIIYLNNNEYAALDGSTSENIDNALNFIPFSQTSPVTQVSQSVTEPVVLADTETNSQEIKPAQTLTISSSHRQNRFRCDVQGCDKEYWQKGHLNRHKSISHQKKRVFCDFTGCNKKFTSKRNLQNHQMNRHENPDSLSTQTSSSRPINQSSAPGSIVGTITEPATPVICITDFEENRHSQVFPAIPAGHSVHDFLTVSDAKALPITLNDPRSGTGMGTRLFPPYTLRQWQQNLIKVRQLPDGKIMTAAQNCTKVVDKLIEGSYSGVFTQADPAPASGLEYSSDIKIIDLNNQYAALDGSTLTLTEQGINKYMQIPVVKKEGSVPCFNANFEEEKFKGTYIEVKQLKPTMQTLAQQYGGWVLAVAALSPLVKLTRKKPTATLSDFKNYGHVCLIQYDYDGVSLIIIDPQLTRQEDIDKCVESDINNVYRFFDPKSPAKPAEFNDHITLAVVNSSVDMRRQLKTESVSDRDSTQASASTRLQPVRVPHSNSR